MTGQLPSTKWPNHRLRPRREETAVYIVPDSRADIENDADEFADLGDEVKTSGNRRDKLSEESPGSPKGSRCGGYIGGAPVQVQPSVSFRFWRRKRYRLKHAFARRNRIADRTVLFIVNAPSDRSALIGNSLDEERKKRQWNAPLAAVRGAFCDSTLPSAVHGVYLMANRRKRSASVPLGRRGAKGARIEADARGAAGKGHQAHAGRGPGHKTGTRNK